MHEGILIIPDNISLSDFREIISGKSIVTDDDLWFKEKSKEEKELEKTLAKYGF